MRGLVPSELIDKDILVEVVNAELEEHLSQISDIYDLFVLTSSLQVGCTLGIGSEHVLIPEELRADHWQYVLTRLVEGGLHASQVMQPGIQEDDSLILLVQGKEGS